MSLLVLVGWTATAVGTVLGIPQLVRLARTRNVEGLSLAGWQAILAINLGWTAHGIRIGQPPQIVASAFSLVATLPILYLLARELGRRTLPTLLPGLGLAAVMIGDSDCVPSSRPPSCRCPRWRLPAMAHRQQRRSSGPLIRNGAPPREEGPRCVPSIDQLQPDVEPQPSQT